MIYKGNSLRYYRPHGEKVGTLTSIPIRLVLSEIESWEENEIPNENKEGVKVLTVIMLSSLSYNIDEKLEVFDKMMEDFLTK